MSTFPLPEYAYKAAGVAFVRLRRQDWLLVELTDGRAVGVPLSLYPTLEKAPPARRNRWRLIGKGDGIHWPALDYDLSVRGIVHGFSEVGTVAPQRPSKRRRAS